MIISMLEKEQAFSAPATVQQIIAAMAPEYEKTALGCFCGGKALELNEPVSESCSLHPITFQNEEGRRIYSISCKRAMRTKPACWRTAPMIISPCICAAASRNTFTG